MLAGTSGLNVLIGFMRCGRDRHPSGSFSRAAASSWQGFPCRVFPAGPTSPAAYPLRIGVRPLIGSFIWDLKGDRPCEQAFFVEQLLLSQVPELLVPAVWLACLFPEFIGADGNGLIN